MYRGKVRWFKKTYGFILAENGEDVFVHYTAIEGDGYKTLEAEQEVTYDLTEDEKGIKAINVKIVQKAPEQETALAEEQETALAEKEEEVEDEAEEEAEETSEDE